MSRRRFRPTKPFASPTMAAAVLRYYEVVRGWLADYVNNPAAWSHATPRYHVMTRATAERATAERADGDGPADRDLA